MIATPMLEIARIGRPPQGHPWRELLLHYGVRLGILAAIVLSNLAALPLLYVAVWLAWKLGTFGVVVALAGLLVVAVVVVALVRSVLGAYQSAAVVRGAVDELQSHQRLIAQQADEIVTRSRLRDEIRGIVTGFAGVMEQLDRAGQALSAVAEKPLEQYERLSAHLDRTEDARRTSALEAARQHSAVAQLVRDLTERHAAQDQRIAWSVEKLERTIEAAAGAYTRQMAEQAALTDESQRLMASLAEATSRLAATLDLGHEPNGAAPRAQQGSLAARTEGEAIADLASMYRLRYETSGDPKDLELAIRYTGEARELFRRTG